MMIATSFGGHAGMSSEGGGELWKHTSRSGVDRME